MSNLNSVTDSYFQYVVAQMAAVGAQVSISGALVNQPFGGIVNARDWPLTPVVEGALYLLILNVMPTGEGTQSQIEYEYFCQWMWLLIGTDIAANQQAESRGDRYRQNMQIMENLRQANYPSFCQKFDYSADVNGNVTSVASASVYPVSSPEMVKWEPLRFMPKGDNQKSGLVFGAAAVELRAYSDVNALVA
jgi:hypothetical protein